MDLSDRMVFDEDDPIEARVSAFQAELLSRRVHTEPFGRWSTYHHASSTFRTLEAWNRPRDTQLAGLAVGAYGVENSAAVFSIFERTLVQDLIGVRAERLAFLYASISESLVASLLEPNSTREASVFGQGDIVSDVDLGELLAVHFASLAERRDDKDEPPVGWLSFASELGAAIERLTGVAPPVFAGCTARTTEEDERALIRAYCQVTQAGHSTDAAALADLEVASRRVPWVAEPMIVLGFAHLSQFDVSSAAEAGKRACATLLAWNSAWDKRLSEFRWFALASFLQAQALLDPDEAAFAVQRVIAILGRVGYEPSALFARLDAVGVIEAPEQPGEPALYEGHSNDGDDTYHVGRAEFDELPSRFQLYMARLGEDDAAQHMRTYPFLTTRPWWEPNDFPVSAAIAERSVELFAELRPGTDQPVGSHLLTEPRAVDTFPALARLIAEHDDVLVGPGGVRLIALGPSSSIAGNQASTNFHLRCVVGLDGADETSLIVDEVADVPGDSVCLMFDPAFPHIISNAGTSTAFLLTLDMWHPELTQTEIGLLAGFTRYVRECVDANITAISSNSESREGH
jgi:hypothetical protein